MNVESKVKNSFGKRVASEPAPQLDWSNLERRIRTSHKRRTAARGGAALVFIIVVAVTLPKIVGGKESRLGPSAGILPRQSSVAINPPPTPQNPSSKPILITVADGCPYSIDGRDGVVNPPMPGLDRVLAPSNPERALICRYTPEFGPQSPKVRHGVLYRSVSVGRDQAMHLAEDLNHIPDGKFGTTHCPADFSESDMLVFETSTSLNVELQYNRSGCRGITNGYASRLGVEATRFGADFDLIAGPTYTQPSR